MQFRVFFVLQLAGALLFLPRLFLFLFFFVSLVCSFRRPSSSVGRASAVSRISQTMGRECLARLLHTL